MTSIQDQHDEEMAKAIGRKLPNMSTYSFNEDETEYLWNLAGADLLTTSQMRVVLMLALKKIEKDLAKGGSNGDC